MAQIFLRILLSKQKIKTKPIYQSKWKILADRDKPVQVGIRPQSVHKTSQH